MNQAYYILLYYCYTSIEDAAAFREAHHRYCIERKLLGRIIIAHEGINGTLSGLVADCEQYMRDLKADPRFASTDFKIAPHHAHAFKKLHVRLKPEIVHAGLPALDPRKDAAPHLSIAEFEKIKDRQDVAIVDLRSNYEHRLGTFRNAITFDIENFREFPEHVEELRPHEDKTIITVCTGNVKCEKGSAYLLQQGFKKVYQLRGGIIRYAMETDGSAFEGRCYVFDNRLSIPINRKQPTIISRCYSCREFCERMINCANPRCNKQIALCVPCSDRLAGACSQVCIEHPARRLYDGTGHYEKNTNGYDPAKGLRR